MALLKSCLFVLVVGILSHYVGEALPRAWFHPDRFPFRAFAWEREGKIYDKLRIRDWKDQLPDMSRVMKDMIPKRVGTCPTAEKVMILVRETCVAELIQNIFTPVIHIERIHWLLALCGGVVYLFWKNSVGVLLSFLVFLGNLPFILIQRYNRPALLALAKRLAEREERKRNARTHSVR